MVPGLYASYTSKTVIPLTRAILSVLEMSTAVSIKRYTNAFSFTLLHGSYTWSSIYP